MTVALCLHCGAMKRGALVSCAACGKHPVGGEVDPQAARAIARGADREAYLEQVGRHRIDVLFTDHYFGDGTLRQLGKLISAINEATADPDLRAATFLRYLTRHHPDVLTAEPPNAAEADALLDRLEGEDFLPSVEITEPSKRGCLVWVVLLVPLLA